MSLKSKSENAVPTLKLVKSAGDQLSGRCFAVACKTDSARMNFCAKHYEQFKFGLIRRDGSQASDYAKKLGQYEARRFKTVRKAA